MQERHLGTAEDVRYIRTHLTALRTVDPIEISTVAKPYRANDLGRVLDAKLFNTIVTDALQTMSKEARVGIEPIPRTRYLFGNPEPAAFGGFHDPGSVGYNYWLQAGFSMLLNETFVPSVQLRTAEAARNYLHDCLHHGTYRTFRRAVRVPALTRELAKARVPEIYREQYGINFRNKDGQPYSSAELTKLSPKAINLNLLMDGVIVLTVAKHMSRYVEPLTSKDSCANDQLVASELLLTEPENTETFPKSSERYVRDVLTPTSRFVAHWGGDKFRLHIVRAMCSGNLGPIKRFFAQQYGERGAWEKVFKNPSFRL